MCGLPIPQILQRLPVQLFLFPLPLAVLLFQITKIQEDRTTPVSRGGPGLIPLRLRACLQGFLQRLVGQPRVRLSPQGMGLFQLPTPERE